MFVLVGLTGASLVLGIFLESEWLRGLACVLSAPTLIAVVVAFFLGVYAPPHAFELLSEREREVLRK